MAAAFLLPYLSGSDRGINLDGVVKQPRRGFEYVIERCLRVVERARRARWPSSGDAWQLAGERDGERSAATSSRSRLVRPLRWAM